MLSKEFSDCTPRVSFPRKKKKKENRSKSFRRRYRCTLACIHELALPSAARLAIVHAVSSALTSAGQRRQNGETLPFTYILQLYLIEDMSMKARPRVILICSYGLVSWRSRDERFVLPLKRVRERRERRELKRNLVKRRRFRVHKLSRELRPPGLIVFSNSSATRP